MDKSWMTTDRRALRFQKGLDEFLMFAKKNAIDVNQIVCPCLKCNNMHSFTEKVIRDHIFFNGIKTSYQQWIWHGEPSTSFMQNNAEGNLGESSFDTVEQGHPFRTEPIDDDIGGSDDEEMSDRIDNFMSFVEDADKPMYPGCTHLTKMSGLVQTFNLKAKYGMSDACYSEMLLMIGGQLPKDNEMPGSIYEAKKYLAALGMDHQKIHACPNDCILYRHQHVNATSCDTCGASRWKLDKKKRERIGVPAKVLWYIPPIPRFRKLFQSPKDAKYMTWHAYGRKKDGKMRHPADSPTWRLVNGKWVNFGLEPRNLRLGLAADGFNPHKEKSSKYSCWPVILVIYNLPPWLCMKRKYMMLTLLISGPKQPGNNIDVYLAPLIEDMIPVWEKGIEAVYDAYREEYFTLRAILLWTVNDFPAYGNLSGSIVKGYNACPICLENTKPYRLKHAKKSAYMRHRRGLPPSHPFRTQAAAFDNTVEEDLAPVPLTGEEVLSRMEDLPHFSFGKLHGPPVFKGLPNEERPCFKKKSIFFQLPYWKHLPIRHMLDVMHIEKNVCEALLGTLLNIPKKTKDSGPARLDMIRMGIRTNLRGKRGKRKSKLPAASWNLFLNEKKIVCSSFFKMKVPTRFSSNISSLVSMEDLKLSGMKSHDCHTILHHLLPIAIRSVLEKPVRYAIIRFCLFFKAICAKEIDTSKLKSLQAELVETVCLLEKYFPPSFFDIMIHLCVHLVRQVELSGPVFFLWMYPFERYMGTLKGYVRNRQHPVGCIVESYIVEEAVEFCSERLIEVGTVGMPNAAKSGLIDGCKALSGAGIVEICDKKLELAHLTVLQNTEEAQPYFIEHMEMLMLLNPRHIKDEKWMKEEQNATFLEWVKNRVKEELRFRDHNVSETMRWMAEGPNRNVLTWAGYHVKGVDFHTKARDNLLTTQNSGVFLEASAMQVASARDKNPVTEDMHFYGVITEIWGLDYTKFRVPVFKCDWVENARGIRVDDLGYTLVNLDKIGHKDDPFVLPTHVKQVFYIDDPLNEGWSVVVKCPEKEYHESDEEDGGVVNEIEVEQSFTARVPPIDSFDDVHGTSQANCMRPGDEKILVDN